MRAWLQWFGLPRPFLGLRSVNVATVLGSASEKLIERAKNPIAMK